MRRREWGRREVSRRSRLYLGVLQALAESLDEAPETDGGRGRQEGERERDARDEGEGGESEGEARSWDACGEAGQASWSGATVESGGGREEGREEAKGCKYDPPTVGGEAGEEQGDRGGHARGDCNWWGESASCNRPYAHAREQEAAGAEGRCETAGGEEGRCETSEGEEARGRTVREAEGRCDTRGEEEVSKTVRGKEGSETVRGGEGGCVEELMEEGRSDEQTKIRLERLKRARREQEPKVYELKKARGRGGGGEEEGRADAGKDQAMVSYE